MINPSRVEKPIVVAIDRPSFTAHMLAPLPRWAMTSRRGSLPVDAGQVFGVTVLLQPIEQAGDSGVVIGQGGGRRLGLSGDDKRRVAADAGDLALDPRAASERQLAERELDAG